MVIKEIKYSTIEEITWLQRKLYIVQEKVNLLEYLFKQKILVVAKLIKELDVDEIAL